VAGALQSGGLQCAATRFGSNQALIWRAAVWEATVWWLGGYSLGGYSAQPPDLDLVKHLPVLKKSYIGPFNASVV